MRSNPAYREIPVVKGASEIWHKRATDRIFRLSGIHKHRVGPPCGKSHELRRGHFNPDQPCEATAMRDRPRTVVANVREHSQKEFSRSLKKHSQSAYYVSGRLLGTKDIMMSKAELVSNSVVTVGG